MPILIRRGGQYVRYNGKYATDIDLCDCTCVEGGQCETCCGSSYDTPSEFRLAFADGTFTGGSSMLPYFECLCCACIQASLFSEYILNASPPPAPPCQYIAGADVCDFNGPEPGVTPGVMTLVLSCAVVEGVEVITATLTYPLNGDAVWQLVGFDCAATEEAPNVLTLVSAGNCTTAPNEVHIWVP